MDAHRIVGSGGERTRGDEMGCEDAVMEVDTSVLRDVYAF